MNPDSTYSTSFEDYSNYLNNFLTFNVYDTLDNALISIFNENIPYDYYDLPNYTIGKLAATAYRTNNTDDWNFKYYKYDARGRVIKQWNLIDGNLYTTDYDYNSANQVVVEKHSDWLSNSKKFIYDYDNAGRMHSTLGYKTPIEFES